MSFARRAEPRTSTRFSPPRRALPLAVAALLAGSLLSFTGASAGSWPDGLKPAVAQSSGPRLLVEFKADASTAARDHALSTAGAAHVGEIADLGVDIVRVPAGGAAHALMALHGDSHVAFAEADAVLQPQEQLPNDPYFLNSGSWNLGGGAWGWYATHTTQAWDITEGDPGTVIAILDTGLKTAGLVDFAGQIASTWNVLSNSVDVSSSAGNHGTYVAGVAGLAIGNGAGNAGYCPLCRLMIVQVGTDSGASLSNLAAGLTYAADHGARVANLSWAGSSDSSTLQSAIDYAHNRGLVVTAAAGNSNCNCVQYPAGDRNVLGVAGVANAAGDKQGDSNYGSWVDVAAPEGNLTAWPSLNGAPGYAAVGGTSVAAPAVAGIAGLVFSYNPSLTNTQVEQALEASSAPVKFQIAYGRVDALAALQALGAADPQPVSKPTMTSPPQLYLEQNGWTSIAPLTSAPQPGQVLVRGIGGWTGSAGLSVSGLQWQRCDGAGANCAALSNQSTYTVQAADAGSTIKLAFNVGNPLGSVPASALSEPVGGSSTVLPPAVVSPPAVSGTAQVGQTMTAWPGTWSGSPTSYAYQWQRCDGSGAGCTPVAGATASAYTAQSADAGLTLRVVVAASNAAGSTTATSVATAAVVPAPTAPAPSPSPAPATTTATFSGSLNPQNQSRGFTVTVGAGTAQASLSFSRCSSLALALSNGAAVNGASVLSLSQTLAAGTYTYTVSGGKCSFSLTVTAASPS